MPNTNTIIRSTAALTAFNRVNPIDFNLYDDEGEQAIYILNDQSPGRTHHLVIANNSDRDLAFLPPSGNRLPNQVNHHFELRFRPGTLDPEYLNWLTIGTGGWRLATQEHFDATDNIHDGTVSLYLLFVGEEELLIPARHTLVLIIHQLKAGIPGGSRGSRMELRYQTDGTQLLTTPAADLVFFRQERLQVINNRGKKELPMIAAFEGTSTVLNDGSTANHLALQVSNLLHNSDILLCARDGESPTKFILSFDTSEEHTAWALCDFDNAAAIDVAPHFEGRQGTSWHTRLEAQGENPQWIITLMEDLPLKVGDYFHLHLNGIKTSMPSGFTKLYLYYQNIPGFWDGYFEVPIEKSPLKFDDQKEGEDHREDGTFIQKTKVGIGNTEPVDTLDVNGGIQAETLVLRNGNNATAPLEVEGKIRAEGLVLSGDLTSNEKLVSKSLTVTESLTVGSVKVTASGPNLQVAGRLKDSTGFVIPPGGIIMWSGKTIPEGWALCDGSNKTPDLRGRFIVGFHSGDSDYNQPGTISEGKTAKGKTGGTPSFKLEEKHLPSHSHSASTTNSGEHSHRLPIDLGGGGTGSSRSGVLHMTDLLNNVGGNNFTINAIPNEFAKTTQEGKHGHSISVGNTGGNRPHENRPPYYVLAFIMKK